MVKCISISKYRKINNINLNFSNTINIISGTNGTCKSSLLHIISNSFQSVTKNDSRLIDNSCLNVINKINYLTNPKIENLTRGDKEYNDPAYGMKGSLFTVNYFDSLPLEFRRHNTTKSQISKKRYAIKPKYTRGTGDSLPSSPVIYLGLSRLFPYGEFQNDDTVLCVNKGLPTSYLEDIREQYKSLTGITISASPTPQKMGDIKVRADFSSEVCGIDANTISAGEDNLFIILTALSSLKYYYDSIKSERCVESILLIDEFDATLHPSLQFRLLGLLKKYSTEYKIQIIFTTHSLSLLEEALKNKYNVHYLIDNITSVMDMPSPDIYKIKMYLHNISRDDLYLDKVIPIFTEDKEARIFLELLLTYFCEHNQSFQKIRNIFHIVDANMGANNLKSIFNDEYLLRSTMQSICILDGDQKSDLTHYTITLPGDKSPEEVVMKYSLELFEVDDSFWMSDDIVNLNYGKVFFRDNIKPDIESIDNTLGNLKNSDSSTHGVQRDMQKKIFYKHERFFRFVFKHWINNPENNTKISQFYNQLWIMFRKTAAFHGINPSEWEKEA